MHTSSLCHAQDIEFDLEAMDKAVAAVRLDKSYKVGDKEIESRRLFLKQTRETIGTFRNSTDDYKSKQRRIERENREVSGECNVSVI